MQEACEKHPAGWFTDDDAELYCELCGSGGTVVEVGTWLGRSMSYALPCVLHAGGEFWAVDPWRATLNGEHRPDEVENQHYLTWMANMKRLGWIGQFQHLRLPSLMAAMLFDNRSLDLVYIDGHHEYGNVLNDIDAWLPKVKPGGWIAGHDFDYGQVSEAVRAKLGEPHRTSGSSWAFKIPTP